MHIPSVYQAGYAEARALNPDLAAAYVGQTVVGDSEADAVVEALAPFSQREVHRFINAGMERDAELLAEAPPPLQAFFARTETPPAWFARLRSTPGAAPSTPTRTCSSPRSSSSPCKTPPH